MARGMLMDTIEKVRRRKRQTATAGETNGIRKAAQRAATTPAPVNVNQPGPALPRTSPAEAMSQKEAIQKRIQERIEGKKKKKKKPTVLLNTRGLRSGVR